MTDETERCKQALKQLYNKVGVDLHRGTLYCGNEAVQHRQVVLKIKHGMHGMTLCWPGGIKSVNFPIISLCNTLAKARVCHALSGYDIGSVKRFSKMTIEIYLS